MKKTLVFYRGRAPKGEVLLDIMHEFWLDGKFSSQIYNQRVIKFGAIVGEYDILFVQPMPPSSKIGAIVGEQYLPQFKEWECDEERSRSKASLGSLVTSTLKFHLHVAKTFYHLSTNLFILAIPFGHTKPNRSILWICNCIFKIKIDDPN